MKGNCCYVERSAVREIVIASDANNCETGAILADIDALPITTVDQFEREIERLRRGLRMIANLEYDRGYEAETFAAAVLSGDEPVIEQLKEKP
jgi:hypothetical protein